MKKPPSSKRSLCSSMASKVTLLLVAFVSVYLLFPGVIYEEASADSVAKMARANAAAGIPPKGRQKIILFGPHDRFNFGDLLFEKVVSHLLVHRAGFAEDQLRSAGVVARDMSAHGGTAQVRSIADLIQESQQAVRSGHRPHDIVFLGGESLNCRHDFAVYMLGEDDALQQQATAAQLPHWNCGYLIRKQELLPREVRSSATPQQQPVAIINSAGKYGFDKRLCGAAVETADYIALRDWEKTSQVQLNSRKVTVHSRPDCAVVTRRFFEDLVKSYAAQDPVAQLQTATQPHGYLAVQHKPEKAPPAKDLARLLDTIHHETKLTTVFFRAGTVPHHDTLEFYRAIAQHMTTPYQIFQDDHVWSVVALLSQARAVLGSSLHVRIMAFVWQKPRATNCNRHSKHASFIDLWEEPNAAPCVGFRNVRELQEILLKSIREHDETAVGKAVDRAIQSYLEGFDQWSTLLRHDDDPDDHDPTKDQVQPETTSDE